MDIVLQKKIKEVGELLANSMIAEELKNAIVTNAGGLSEDAIDKLLSSLREEKKYLHDFERSLADFQKEADKEWELVLARQEGEIKAWADDAAKKLKEA